LTKRAAIPSDFILHQNVPNPFNPTTTLHYKLPNNIFVTISIYNMLGQQIKVLVNDNSGSGARSVQWDGTDSMGQPVSAGVYLYQIQTGEFVQTKKMVLLK
jgi:flagellar hook assembly protein FlgD